VVRVDQYYPHWSAVDPYHIARKAALGKVVAPSTSILVGGLLNTGAQMDVQMMAVTRDSGLDIEPMSTSAIPVPRESGYSTCLRVGDLLFIAGQLARDESGEVPAAARVPASALWKGTRIRLETDYLIAHRLKPAIEAGGGSLDTILKAQVYLSHPDDFPAFWQSWSAAFSGKAPPTTIVPVEPPAFGSRDATIEINVIAARTFARDRIRDVDCGGVLPCPGMLAARAFDELVFVAGLMALDDGGLATDPALSSDAPFFHSPAASQMENILDKAQRILKLAGTDLDHVVRALHFHGNLADFPSAYREWPAALREHGLPFSAVQVSHRMFVPAAAVIADLWATLP
jgi:enamine deaminase RidA (YjgF/YER057c/UK114 family)